MKNKQPSRETIDIKLIADRIKHDIKYYENKFNLTPNNQKLKQKIKKLKDQLKYVDPEQAYSHVIWHIEEGPWPPGEKAIASDPKCAFRYAVSRIERPWPPGEKAIASDPEYAYKYARDVIKGRWPPGEKAIASNSKWKAIYQDEFKVKL